MKKDLEILYNQARTKIALLTTKLSVTETIYTNIIQDHRALGEKLLGFVLAQAEEIERLEEELEALRRQNRLTPEVNSRS